MIAGFRSRLVVLACGMAAAVLLAAPQQAAAQGLDRNQVFELQFRLNQLGFNAGRLDGQAGGRTRSAVHRFADAHDTRADLTPAFLALVRAEARSIEGLARDDGAIDFLVFTDEGTPLILTIEAIGQLSGPQISAAAALPQGSDPIAIPGEAGVAFGVAVRVPTPPAGERLTIEHVVSEPRRLADGTIRFTEHVTRHAIPPDAADQQQWVWRFETPPDPIQADGWRFALENRGDILLTRTFKVGG